MAINTILLDLSVDPEKIVEKNTLKLAIEDVLTNFIPELKESYSTSFQGGGFLSAYTAIRDSFITVRGFPCGLVAINVEYYKDDLDDPLMTFETVRKLEVSLTNQVCSKKTHKYPALRRGGKADRYFLSSDERILEYDVDGVVFEQQSPYQKVQIVHSKSLGNILILDELQNMSEKDMIYTETLMQRGKENYTDKEIVILGGGDGGLLYELLKENPKYVTMLELDEVVMQACKVHLRSICGDCLDQMEGPNYKIVIGDCLETIDSLIAEGKKVDYVFGDLTDIPVSTTPQGEAWDFIRLILNKSFQILKPTGKYMTHGNGVTSTASLAMFEEQLRSSSIPVEFSTAKTFVPSFLEEWVFYQIWPKQTSPTMT